MPAQPESQPERDSSANQPHRHRQVAESFGLGEAFAGVYRRVMPDSPNVWAGPILEAYLTMCGKAADGIRQAGRFGDAEEWRFGWDRRYTRDEWVDQVPTFGGHTQLPPATLDDLLAGVGAAVDAAGGSFTI